MDEGKIYSLLLEIHKEMGVIQSDIAAIEVDLKEHMRRTAVAEARIDVLSEKHSAQIATLQKANYMVQGAMALLSLIATGAAIYHYLR